MGVDTDLGVIFSDIVSFLESLRDIDLPLDVENTRDNLAQRTKIKLAALTGSRESTSPEPYLDMNAGKGLLQSRINKGKQNEIEEYVGADERTTGAPSSRQSTDYYESFNEFGETNVGKINATTGYARDEQFEDKLRDIYKTFTRAEVRSKALKYSNLEQKIERKSFAFLRDTIRPCWVGLVGSHLIVYENNDEKQPSDIFSIRGYKVRPAPSAVPKDPERAKSAFEIFCPGNKTLQFIAGSPKEMVEWVMAIDRTSADFQKNDIPNNLESIDLKRSDDISTNRKPEISSPIGIPIAKPNNGNRSKTDLSSCETKKKSVELSTGNSPPILPVRLLPRRLPSLPNEQIPSQPSYEPMDDCYEEDDIYHKIDDFRYENLKEKTGNAVFQKGRSKKSNKRKKSKESAKQESPAKQIIETYDDVQTIARENRTSPVKEIRENRTDRRSIEKDESFFTYDDVAHSSQTVHSETPISGESIRTKIDRSPTKSSPKRWFLLDRVRNKKDSPKKDDKSRIEGRKCRKKLEKEKEKMASDSSPLPISEEPNIVTEYDDVSDFVDRRTKVDLLSNYNSPPPPRPIYAKSASRNEISTIEKIEENKEIQINSPIVEEVYDDISNYRDAGKVESRVEKEESGSIDRKNILSSRKSAIFENDNNENSAGNYPVIDTEHYQIPRRNSHHSNQCCVASQQQQELYDDIAILADFRAKQRDSVISAGDKLTISIKKPWNRFGSGKKITARAVPAVETPKKNISNTDLQDASEANSDFSSVDKHEAAKLNKLQKLYNKVESTLGKQPSGRSIDPILNKPRKSE